jgi:hypothetical protein
LKLTAHVELVRKEAHEIIITIFFKNFIVKKNELVVNGNKLTNHVADLVTSCLVSPVMPRWSKTFRNIYIYIYIYIYRIFRCKETVKLLEL